jgi:hypothetical protein
MLEDLEEAEARGDFASRRSAETEKEFYRDFMEQQEIGSEPLEGAIYAVLGGPGPDCRKVAFLRALYDTKSSRREDAFAYAVESLPDAHKPEGVSIPAFAVRFLSGHAQEDAVARRVLERAAFLDGWLAEHIRRTAAAGLFASAGPAELRYLGSYLYSGQASFLREGASEGLRGNPHREEAEWVRDTFLSGAGADAGMTLADETE